MHPYFLISQLSCAKSTEVIQPSSQEQNGLAEETTQPLDEDPHKQTIIRTANPPPPKLPPPKEDSALPTWEQVAAPDNMPNATSGLALSSDGLICFKEFFGDRTVHPHVRRYGGRILMKEEEAQGPQIQCPSEQRSALIQQLKSANELPDGID